MKKIIKYFSDKGMPLILGALLLIFMVISIFISDILNVKYDKQTLERQTEILEGLILDSDYEEKGLNRHYILWDYDLKFLRDDFPQQFPEYENYINQGDWYDGFSRLIDDINIVNISDDDIYQRVKGIVPVDLLTFIKDDYLKAIAVMNRELIQ